MPKTIGEVFNELALKAGIAVDNNELKSLLASPELATVTVPDELVSSIDNNLLSIEAAKNNHPDIKKKYSSEIFDGMDKNLLKLIESDTFDQADVDEIKAEKNTYKKAELIITKLKEAKSKATGADKETINKQLKEAHEAARLANEKVTQVKNEYEGKIKDIQKTAALKAMFGNYKTIYDDLPGDIKSATLEALINKALQDKNAEFRPDEHGTLQLLAKDGSNVFGSNHVQLTPESLLNQTFAPILKVSGPPKPATSQRQTPPPTSSGTGVDDAQNVFIKSHNQQVLADMATAKPSMI